MDLNGIFLHHLLPVFAGNFLSYPPLLIVIIGAISGQSFHPISRAGFEADIMPPPGMDNFMIQGPRSEEFFSLPDGFRSKKGEGRNTIAARKEVLDDVKLFKGVRTQQALIDF